MILFLFVQMLIGRCNSFGRSKSITFYWIYIRGSSRHIRRIKHLYMRFQDFGSLDFIANVVNTHFDPENEIFH